MIPIATLLRRERVILFYPAKALTTKPVPTIRLKLPLLLLLHIKI